MTSDALIATLALGGLCLLMWWLARLARKRMGLGAGTVSSSGLRVVGKRPLDQKHSLYVVEIAGGRHILVGTSMDGGISKVDDISPDEYARMVDEPAAPKPLRMATSDATDADPEEPVQEQQRFATVGESFGMLLGKARDARANRKASGDD
jgi:flagellar biogenesis protein FliO